MEENLNRRSLLRLVGDAVDGRERRGHLIVELVELQFQFGLFAVGRAPQLHLQPALLLFERRRFQFPLRLFFLTGEHDVIRLGLREVGFETVVVGLAEGVELVIVTARAADGHAEERGADDVGHLGEDFVVGTGDVLIAGVFAQRTEAVEAAGHEHGGILRVDFVAGELLFDEVGVRLVGVEALDHVIAIAPGVGPVHVVLIAVGLGEAHDIEPVAAPLFAVVRRSEEAIHDFLPGLGRLVAHEGIDFLGGGRETGEIESDAADQRGAIGGGRRT